MKKILIETLKGSLKPVKEGKAPRKGVLCTLEGPCMQLGVVNENSRLYTESLAKNRILLHKPVQEKIKIKSMLGEGKHPVDRVEIDYTQVALSVEKLWIPEHAPDKLYGRFAILDTPTGQILNSLVEYGTVLGVSARAMGEGVIRDGVEVIDEKTYDLVTFDAVPDPGFNIARLSKVESLNKPVRKMTIESLQSTAQALRGLDIPELSPRINEIERELSARILNESMISGKGGLLENLNCIRHELKIEKIKRDAHNKIRYEKLEDLISTLKNVNKLVEKKVSSLQQEIRRLSNDKEELLKRLYNKTVQEQKSKNKPQRMIVENFNRNASSYLKESEESTKKSKSLYNENDSLHRIINKTLGGK